VRTGASTAALSTASKRASHKAQKMAQKRLQLKEGAKWEALALLDVLQQCFQRFTTVYGLGYYLDLYN
jgi:hypothetical protein